MPVDKTDSLSQSSLPPQLLFRNVVVAGKTGVGKSSFINLVTGSDNALIGNDTNGVTGRPRSYSWETDAHTHAFRLWDTPGFHESSDGHVSHWVAQYILRSLLRELGKNGGVHLLVLCMHGNAKGIKQTYDIVLRIRNQVSPKTPVVAVVTESEKWWDESNIVTSMESWWSCNQNTLAGSGITFCGHACLTTLADDCHPPMPGRYAECQRLARNLLIDCSLPFSAFDRSTRMSNALSSLSQKLTYNIVIVGQTGVGKSSIINLVLGSESAKAASDVCAVTEGTSYHDWNLLQTQKFRLWDTPGLGQSPSGGMSSKHSLNALRSLLAELGRGAGVHLIILCYQGSHRVTNSMKETYDSVLTLRNCTCPDTPLVAVVTKLECKSNPPDPLIGMDQWWHNNINDMTSLRMTFSGHACITTLSDSEQPPIPGRWDDCQRLVRNLIIDYTLTPRSVPPQDLHIVLFGEMGVGKSSLVNLLSGWRVAEVSPNTAACTLSSTEYQFQLGAATIWLWDTAGLEEPESGTREYMSAIEEATKLIRRLSASGGISLFLFCVRGSRVTTTMQNNYRLFYEVLGKKRVPIALAVTHLEREPVMEEWWKRNVKTLKRKGIRVDQHACITTLEGHPKYAESRLAVQELLWLYADQGKFLMSPETWLGRLLKELSALLTFALPKGRDMVRVLTQRCNLTPDIAQRVADCIERTDNL